MPFEEKTDWRDTPSAPAPPGSTPVYAADIKRWERGIAEAHEELVGKLSKADADATYGRVKTINGQAPNAQGNIVVEAGATGPLGVSDFVNSWWCVPRSIHHTLRNVVYQGGVNREGTMQITTFDLRRRSARKISLGTFEKDDHNVPAFLVEDDKPPIVAIVRHAVENFVRIRIGAAPHDIDSLATATEIQVPFPAACTYAHLIRRPGTNTVALLTRNEDGWYLSMSTDWGATWGTPVRFHGLAYGTFRKYGNTVHYVVTTHPTTTPNNALRYFRINVATGDITSASGTALGNLWSFSSVISATSMTYARQSYDSDTGHNTNRLFDILPDGSILAMQFHKSTPELGGTYGVYRFAATGAAPSSLQDPNAPQRGWVFEPIVASGVPVGYYQSSYVGGMTSGANENEVWLAREASGTWTIERWTKTGAAWSLADTIATRTAGEKLGRPQVPWGAEGTGLFTGIEYFRYPSDTFMDYYGDQLVLQTGITSPVAGVDTTSPTIPTGLSATAGVGSVALSWTASTDNVGVVGYEIYQSLTYLATVTGTSHTVNGLAAQSYTFRIKAVDAAGNKSDYGVFPAATPLPSSGEAILPTAGALVLIDPTNTVEQWPAGVPTTTVRNLASAQAFAAAGVGAEADYNFTVSNSLTATDGLVERTSKGGLHFLISQSTGVGGRSFTLDNERIRAYMAANLTHSYFISLWASVTRLSAEATPSTLQRFAGFLGSSNNDTITARLATGNKMTVAPSANRLGVKESTTPITADSPNNVSGAHSQIPAIGASPKFIFAGHFNTDAAVVNKGASWILYRVYLEDLTASGRTYAQVSSTDNTLFSNAFGSGGRYAGDTHTAVSSLP